MSVKAADNSFGAVAVSPQDEAREFAMRISREELSSGGDRPPADQHIYDRSLPAEFQTVALPEEQQNLSGMEEGFIDPFRADAPSIFGESPIQLEYYSPGTKFPASGPDAENIYLAPHGAGEGSEAHFREAMRADYDSMIKKYPLLREAVSGLGQFMDERQGLAVPPQSYFVIDLIQGTTYFVPASELCEKSGPDFILVPADDINRMRVADASADVVFALRDGRLDIARAREEIQERLEEIEGYRIGEISLRTHYQAAKLKKIEAEIALLKSRRSRIKGTVKTATKPQFGNDGYVLGEMWAEKQGREVVPELDRRIGALDVEREFVDASVAGLARAAVSQNAMLALAHGQNEDDALSQAGALMRSFGSDRESHRYFSEAKEAAALIGDKPGEMRHELSAISVDPALDEKARTSRLDAFISGVEKARGTYRWERGGKQEIEGLVFLPPGMNEEMMKAVDREFVSIRADAISELVRSAAKAAGDDAKDESLKKSLALLDREIDEASTEAGSDPARAASLIAGATAAIEPFVAAAEKKAKDLDLEKRDALIEEVLTRAKRVEWMYVHQAWKDHDAIDNPMLSDSFARFGAKSYFDALRRTGLPYKGVLKTFEEYVPRYPESEVKNEIVAQIRADAPHLFDGDGNFLPRHLHRAAPDAARASEEVRKLNLLPGTLLEKVGTDLTATTLSASLFAKGGGAVCAPAGPEAALTCAGAGGTIGFTAGMFGGAGALRLAYDKEIGKIESEARMVGMDLAGLKAGEGDKNVAFSMGYFALGAAFAPTWRPFANTLDKFLLRLGPEGRHHAWRMTRGHFAKTVDLFPTIWRAAKGFVNASRKTGDDLSLLPVVEQMARLLGVGSKETPRNLDKAVAAVVREARTSLTDGIAAVMGRDGEAVAADLATIIVSEDAGAYARLGKFEKLLKRVSDEKVGQLDFERNMGRIFEISADDPLVKGVSKNIFVERQTAARSQQMADALSGRGDRREFVVNLLRAVGKETDEDMLREIGSAVGPASVPKLIKLLELLKLDGTRTVQLERLMKSVVRDEKNGRTLLETMLTAETREELLARTAVKRIPIDPHALAGKITDAERASLHGAVRKLLEKKARQTKLATDKFFKSIDDISGMKEFFSRAKGEHVAVIDTHKGREAIIKLIADDEVLCREFVELILGKGLAKSELRSIPKEARESLMEALIKPVGDVSKELQHPMKDILRRVLHSEWMATDLADIADVTLRAERRVARRALSQAITMSDAAGEDFAREIIEGYVAPWDKRTFGKYLFPEGGAQGVGAAVAKIRSQTREVLTGQVKQAIEYTPEEGVLDPLLRVFNRGYDAVARPADMIWARRISTSAKFVTTANSGMSFRENPFIWRKMILRQAHLASQTEGGGGGGKELGWFLRNMEDAYSWISHRFGTEEFRRAHRVCLPILVGDYAYNSLTSDVEGLDKLGVICAMVGANYYAEKLGLSKTHALDIAVTQRSIGTMFSKTDSDSKQVFDGKRTLATYGEMHIALLLQSFAMYGLNYAEKTPFGQVLGNLPFITSLPLAMNSRPFFGFYGGDVAKPDFLMGGGFFGGVRGLAFATMASTAQSYGIAHFTQHEKWMNASRDYKGWRGLNYSVNGPLVNVPGFWVNRRLEAHKPDADLRSTMRQLVERILGTATSWGTLKFLDVYAGKGEFAERERDLLADAAAGNAASSKSRREAWNVFARRNSIDLIGWWDRVDAWRMSAARDRIFEPHVIEPGVNLLQMKSWYTEGRLKFPDKKMHHGFLVELASERPALLREILAEFEAQLADPHAAWRDAFLGYSRRAEGKMLYYFSLMVKHLAHKADAEGKSKYRPFAELIARSPYQDYWCAVPLCEKEEDVEKTMILMEDQKIVKRVVDGGVVRRVTLDDLLAHVRKTAVRVKKSD